MSAIQRDKVIYDEIDNTFGQLRNIPARHINHTHKTQNLIPQTTSPTAASPLSNNSCGSAPNTVSGSSLITNPTYSSPCGLTLHRGKPEKNKEALKQLKPGVYVFGQAGIAAESNFVLPHKRPLLRYD